MGQLLHETLWLQEQATVRSNQGIERRCRALVPGTTSGDLLPVTSSCGWDMITDWPWILTPTCKLKTNFDKRLKAEGDEAQDTGLLAKQIGNKRQPTSAHDKGQNRRDHDQRQDTEDKVRGISQSQTRHEFRQEDHISRPRTQDITKDRKTLHRIHCNQPKLDYKGLKDLIVTCKIYNKRRKEERLYQNHNQKLSKILSFILIFLFLPSATSRCITLPDNNINQKGRTAKVKFSTVDCSIQKISIPLSSQETNAGLLPLQFKVYEYGTKPGEELTTKLQDKTTDKPEDDPSPSLPADKNEIGKEVTLKSEHGNSHLTEDGKDVSEAKLDDFKVTDTLAEINLSEEDGKLLPQPGPQDVVDVVNGGLENNDNKPELNIDGVELTQNEKVTTLNNDKEIIYNNQITDAKITQLDLLNEDVKFTKNLSNVLAKEVQPSTIDSTKIENKPGVNLDIAYIDEVQSDSTDIALKDPIGKNVEEESSAIKDKTMMPNNVVENYLKGKETTLSNQSEKIIATPNQEKTTQTDVEISIPIDDDNSAIAPSRNKTMIYSDGNMEETTKQIYIMDEIITSNHHSKVGSSIELTELTKKMPLNEANTIESTTNQKNTDANVSDITENIQKETKEPLNFSIIQMTKKQNITKETSNENTADKVTMSIMTKDAKSTHNGHIGVPTNVESEDFSVNSKETTNVEEYDLEISTIRNYDMEMSHQANPSNDVEMKITLEDKITTFSTRDSDQLTLKDDTRTEIYSGNYETSKSVMPTEKYDDSKTTNENLSTGNTETEGDYKDVLPGKETTVINAKTTNRITGITELLEIGTNSIIPNTDEKDTNQVLGFDRTAQVSAIEKEISTHGAISREPQKQNQSTKSSKEATRTDKTTVYISKERPIVNEGSDKTNNIVEQPTESLIMTQAENQYLNTAKSSYPNVEVMSTTYLSFSNTEMTSRHPQKENQTTKSSKEATRIDKTTVYNSKERPIVNEGSDKTNNIGEQLSENLHMTQAQNQSLNTTKVSYPNVEFMITPNMSVSDIEITPN